MNYRLKTHDELLNTGFALSPAGVYVHPKFDNLTLEMRDYASQLSPSIIKVLFDSPYGQRKFIDAYIYCAEHFLAEPHLKLVGV